MSASVDALPLPYRTLLVPGRGVAALPHLEAFLPEISHVERASRLSRTIDAVAGWGFKPTAAKARTLAARAGLPYLALEDGFFRSIGLGENGTPPLSLVADDLGIYYDARQPSRIEHLLEAGGWESAALLARAEAAMARVALLGLSKTNASPPATAALLPPRNRRRILLVDQTAGDASIEGGLASGATFVAMLQAARDAPECEIVLRRHPAVAAGLKRGALPAGTDLSRVVLLDHEARASDILAEVDEVWTVTSLTGFEALIRGLPVRCFGMPFYAGWGLTRDEQRCARRTRRRTPSELFAAACLLYTRYVDPISGRPTTLEDTIERLGEWRDVADANAGPIAAVGFRPWKRGATRNLLSAPTADLSFHPHVEAAAAAARRKNGRLMIWSGKETPALRRTLTDTGLPVLRMEDGFLRSRGLGSDFHLPASVVLDDVGIYYDRHSPSRLEAMLESAVMPDALLARAHRLREWLVATGVTKYNVGTAAVLPDASGRFRLLVVGQVEDDRSIERGTGSIRTNLSLVEWARASHPDAWIAYKPHPDVEAGNRRGAISPSQLVGLADHIATDANIAQCLAQVDGLATMTSLAGFEALIRGLPVWTAGGPFYAGWGLTEDLLDFPRRTRRLTLDMLVAGTLLLYPRYIHPPSGLPARAEELADWLDSDAPPPGHRRLRWLRALAESVIARPPARY